MEGNNVGLIQILKKEAIKLNNEMLRYGRNQVELKIVR